MRLVDALRLGKAPRLALVGAGGKTTALFQLARELSNIEGINKKTSSNGLTVLISTTTHLAIDETVQADRHFTVQSLDDVSKIELSPSMGVVLFSGPPVDNQRVGGVNLEVLDEIKTLADTYCLPLLVEADGSRRRPVKAPALHEPLIPSWVDTVVVVAGLSALGAPLMDQWVHRAARFAELSGLSLGSPITPQALVRVLSNKAGGLKGIPSSARGVVLLNKADTAELQSIAHHLSKALLEVYHAVIIASLKPGIGRAKIHAVHEPIAGVILAAGAATRFGKVKQVLIWRGEPIIRHVTRTALEAGLSPVVVVIGYAASQVQSALKGMPISFAFNPSWKSGQSTSVIRGLNVLPNTVGGAIFLLADQPLVPVSLMNSLVERHSETLAPLVAPQVQGQRANPILFDQLTFPDLLSLTGDVGGRQLFSRYRVEWVPWLDSTITLDIDTLEDYERLLAVG